MMNLQSLRLILMFMVVLCCILMSPLESFHSDHDEYEGSRNGVKREREDLAAHAGGGGGGHGGESGGKGESGNSNNNNGGAGVIPVYAAAGAANKHHNNGHQSAGSSQILNLGFALIPIFMAQQHY